MNDNREREMRDRDLGESWRDWSGKVSADVSGSNPSLFAALTLACFIAICAVAASGFYMISPRLLAWNPFLKRAVGLTLSCGIAFFGIFILLTALSLWVRRDLMAFIPSVHRQAFLLVLYPACERIGRFFGFSRDTVISSFITFNNRLVLGSPVVVPETGLLVLLPRCLQSAQCDQHLIDDVRNCRRCGKCDISNLAGLMERYRFSMAVVTGGRLAKRLVQMFNPSAVIAVACERELLAGLRNVAHIPVVGIINKRPEGPCRNTRIDLGEFEEALKSLIVAK